jgi:hypothetical protein
LSLGAVVLGIINHKRIRSNCCGKEASVSLDIENTTPKREAFVECPTKLSASEEATKSRRTSLAEPSTSASPP